MNDADIPFHQTELICKTILGSQHVKSDLLLGDELETDNLIMGSQGPAVLNFNKKGFPSLRFELVAYGGNDSTQCICGAFSLTELSGHNRIITYTPVAAAVVRAFEDLFE